MASAWGESWGIAWGDSWGGGSVIPPVVVGHPPAAGSSRGYDAWTQAEIERERVDRELSRRESEVIERVAREQAQRDELNGIAAAAELSAAMEASELRWRTQYEAALEAYTNLIRAEMARAAAERSRIELEQANERARREAAIRNARIALLLLLPEQ